ncbi:geranylgeranyl transferase type-2 subunit beta [Anaeramoeba flamelloides]|uniref:Geranylgeranyl transferase type-2 subunit beta n=1 Tax=Anaeramoeba flamelloides TaxID=1746091 RepID=A0ABQ8YBP0_9EUKA|nr:geranylgeranyl transferase type-2 subunit beta [Anaeramoeba flamelloides]
MGIIEKIFLVLALLIVLEGTKLSENKVLSELHKYQDRTNGGFSNEIDETATIQGTFGAVILSTLYGFRDENLAEGVTHFVEQCANSDFGYGSNPKQASELESTFYSTWIYRLLGTLPDTQLVSNYILSLLDRETMLFAPKKGGRPSVHSTTLAFQTLDLIGESWESVLPENTAEVLKTKIKKGMVVSDTEAYFNFGSSNIVYDNYHGIVLAKYLKIELGPIKPWVNFIKNMQAFDGKNDGSFYDDITKEYSGIESTTFSLLSLKLLAEMHSIENSKTEIPNFFKLIDKEELKNFLTSKEENLWVVSRAHFGLALIEEIFEFVETFVEWETINGDKPKELIEGTDLRLVFTAKTFSSLRHGGLDIKSKILFKAENKETFEALKPISYTFDQERRQYISEKVIQTNNKVGKVLVETKGEMNIVGLGKVSFIKETQNSIGYKIDIIPSASVAGTEIELGGTASIGTTFDFIVKLSSLNDQNPRILSGDFDVSMTIFDSSLFVVDHQVLDCRDNKDEIKFNYVLSNTDLPSGTLFFRFEVGNEKVEIHTSKSIHYNVDIPMISSNIEFKNFKQNEKINYKIGDKVEISLQSGSIPDLITPIFYKSKNSKVTEFKRVDGTKIPNGNWNFFMEVTTPSGEVVKTVESELGETENGMLIISFNYEIAPILNNLGTNIVNFYYLTATGQSIPLTNLENRFKEESEEETEEQEEEEEANEDFSQLSFNVDHNLQMTEVSNYPNEDDFFYGNKIVYVFKVLDTISEKLISQEEENTESDFGIYLELLHKESAEEESEFISVSELAKVSKDTFMIKWTINPNAIKGEGKIRIIGKRGSETRINILQEQKETEEEEEEAKYCVYDIAIGGEINVNHELYQTLTKYSSKTVFFIEFELQCKQKTLEGAKLYSTLKYVGDNKDKSQVIDGNLYVNHHDKKYQVTFVDKHENIKPGKYEMVFYRDIDQQRAARNGWDTVEPLFSVEIPHPKLKPIQSSISGQFILIALLGAIFVWISMKTYQIEKMPSNN